MKQLYVSVVAGALALGGIGITIAVQSDVFAQPRRAGSAPVDGNDRLAVVELFQSQGCSSCPPAAANINALASNPHVLALSYGVTYWDRLGWKDTFASPLFTSRQWEYARRKGRARVWTPQVYVDGQGDVVGANRAQLDQLIARSSIKGPSVRIAGSKVQVGDGRAAKPATVWMVRYDPRTVQVPIRAGENGGRTLPHRNVVRELVKIGSWKGRAASFALPAGRESYRTAVLVQDGEGGAIIGAAKV